MLVLTRYVEEKIVIMPPSGERIEVLIAGVSGNKVRIGIDAPRSVVVDRMEIHYRRPKPRAMRPRDARLMQAVRRLSVAFAARAKCMDEREIYALDEEVRAAETALAEEVCCG